MKTSLNKINSSIATIIIALLAITYPTFAVSDTFEDPALPERTKLSYCPPDGTSYSVVTLKDSYGGGAIQVSEEETERYDKCLITEIEVETGMFYNMEKAPVTFFFTRNLNEKPFYTFTVFMDLDRSGEKKTYKIPEPVSISAGEPFFAGFIIYANGSNGSSYTIFMRELGENPYPGGYYGFSNNSGNSDEMEWSDYSDWAMVYLSLTIEGYNLPRNTVELVKLNITDHVFPTQPLLPSVYIHNRGIDSINDVDLSYIYGENKIERVQYRPQYPLPSDGWDTIYGQHTLSIDEEGLNIPVTVRIDKVNGQIPSNTSRTVLSKTLLSLSFDSGFPHNMVVEEAGGRGCPWCVRGIVGLDRTFKAHDDGTFIPISIHDQGYGEETSAYGYQPFLEKHFYSIPSCLINRKIERDPNSVTLETEYCDITSIPAIAEIEICSYSIEGEWLTVDSGVRFALPEENGDYSIAYVITEDHAGPVYQNNAYSGTNTDMDGWENLPSQVLTYYDFLARGISDIDGTQLTLPKKIEPKKDYSHSDHVYIGKVKNMSNIAIVAMLINNRTGCIENGCRKKISDINYTIGITSDPSMIQAEYYDLSGRRLSGQPISGFYILRQGSQSEKILIR